MKVVTYKNDNTLAKRLMDALNIEINQAIKDGKEIAFIELTETEFDILRINCKYNLLHTSGFMPIVDGKTITYRNYKVKIVEVVE